MPTGSVIRHVSTAHGAAPFCICSAESSKKLVRFVLNWWVLISDFGVLNFLRLAPPYPISVPYIAYSYQAYIDHIPSLQADSHYTLSQYPTQHPQIAAIPYLSTAHCIGSV
eukprot:1254346-Rhodomonas_salina.1